MNHIAVLFKSCHIQMRTGLQRILPMLMAGTSRVGSKALAYNAIIFFIFFIVYASIDFATHFTLPWGADMPHARTIGYFTMMTHAAVGTSDIEPKTEMARTLVTLHVFLAWMSVFVLLK